MDFCPVATLFCAAKRLAAMMFRYLTDENLSHTIQREKCFFCGRILRVKKRGKVCVDRKDLTMKKVFAMLLILALLLTGCKPGVAEPCTHADSDHNGRCDLCDSVVAAKPEPDPVVSDPIGSDPVESDPVESDPIESDPVKSDPIESDPVESDPVENDPVESDPIGSDPVESDPVESNPIESDPVESDPVESDPVEPEPTTAPCAHADSDDNGSCDLCDCTVTVSIDFYAINDLHGKLADGESHPGVDELTTFLKSKQAEEYTVLLSVGDMWQGSGESNMTQGMIITDWMNELGFAAMTLGNHEYDWGEAVIERHKEAAQFPLLGINIFSRDTNSRVDYCEASTVVDIGGIQVGIIGAMGDCYSSIAGDKTEDIYFVTGSALTKLVKEESRRLREEKGVELVVYSIHDGSSSGWSDHYDYSLSDGYVDLVFEGHTHQGYLTLDEHGVYHLQNRGDNYGGISHVEITVNTVTGSHEVSESELISTDTYDDLPDDPLVSELMEKYADEISAVNRELGYNKVYRSSEWLCNKVAELYYRLGVEVWGDEYDITLGGGFLAARSPYNLHYGQVTYGQLQSLFPFDNDIVLCSIRGSDLLKRFVHSDNYKYHIYGDYKNIDPNGTYYIVVDTYTSIYAPNRLTEVAAYTPGIYARDLLAEYVAAGGLE